MNYIHSFTESDLCNVILQTQKSLYICMPLLQPEVINAIDQLQYESSIEVSINIGIDFSPETFRQGYGEIENYEELNRAGYTIKNFKDNRISFVISDDTGYFLFFESRYFIPANKPTYNAVSIDPISIIRLKQHFFDAYKSEAEYKNEIANSFVDETVRLNTIREEYANKSSIEKSELSDSALKQVTEDLKKNPPLKPDYQRIVRFYTHKFQYIKLEYKGANLQSKKIDIPSRILPIKNATFKKNLETKLNLFTNRDSEFFNDLEEMNNRVKALREKYLTPLTSRKVSILKSFQKSEFKEAVEELKKDIEALSNKNLLQVAQAISETKVEISKQLKEFFIQYKEEFPSYNTLFRDAEESYVMNEIDNYVDQVIAQIKWPAAHQLFEKFNLEAIPSGITYEDLTNESLIRELKERGLFDDEDDDNLAVFSEGIELIPLDK
ncbi:MAG: hypothetical protein PHU68_02205 [Paludibacter sp.]|nr:hypothetical protein [Paludibacter sp.]